MRSILFKTLPLLSLIVTLFPATSNSWTNKPIRLVVPFNAGGTIDTVARSFGQKLSISVMQPVIVENKPGGGSLIGAEYVAKSLPDGNTLLLATNGLAIASELYKKKSFDPKKDLTPVTELMSTYMTVVVSSHLQINTFNELLAYAKAKPGELNYGSTGIGSAPHLVMEMLKTNAKINLTHIPYNGDAPMNQALLAGNIDAVITPVSGVIESMKAGKVRILATTDTKRSDLIANVPTIAESGLPGFEYLGWVGVFAASGTDADLIKKINSEFSKILFDAEMKEKISTWGYERVGSTAESFKNKYQDDLIRYAKVIKDIPINLDQ